MVKVCEWVMVSWLGNNFIVRMCVGISYERKGVSVFLLRIMLSRKGLLIFVVFGIRGRMLYFVVLDCVL